MKKILLIFIILFFSFFRAGAVKKIEANPINVAYILAQETDSAKMASTCEYYGYERQLHQDGKTLFTHPNGSTISYKYNESDQKYPIIEVSSKATQKEKELTLKNLNFQKVGKIYERHSIGHTTRCTNGNHGSLILSRHPKQQN